MAKLENNFGISIGDRESTAWSEGRNFDLKIDLLGGFSLKLGGKAISVANRKACALLGVNGRAKLDQRAAQNVATLKVA